jgi:hypothetical protein
LATLELQPDERHVAAADAWLGYAHGLLLESSEPFPGVQPAPATALLDRVTTWTDVPAEEVEAAWRIEDGELLLERRHPDGRLFLRIDACETLGYRIWAPYYGRHLVSADGTTIASALPRVPVVRWQRLFFAQVLPLAAALQGLSLVRAGAVAVRGRAVAVIGPPESGKTALAAHLVALGATFVSDDVLALEKTAHTVVAHPGPTRLSIDEAELRRIPSTQEERMGPCVGRSDKLMIEPEAVSTPLAVTRLYVLRPDPGAVRIAIAPRDASQGPSLLGSYFVNYLRSPSYLERQLEVNATFDASLSAYEIAVPRGARARDLAARVLAHCGEPPA